MKKGSQRGEKDSDFSKEEDGLPLLMEGNSKAIHDFQFEEGAYFEAVVDMKEWFYERIVAPFGIWNSSKTLLESSARELFSCILRTVFQIFPTGIAPPSGPSIS